jgi:hypothetical protein
MASRQQELSVKPTKWNSLSHPSSSVWFCVQSRDGMKYKMPRRIFGRKRAEQENGGNYTTRSFIILLSSLMLGWLHREGWDGGYDGEIRSRCKLLVGTRGEKPHGKSRRRPQNIKVDLWYSLSIVRMRTRLNWIRRGFKSGFCDDDDELWGWVIVRKFLTSSDDYALLRCSSNLRLLYLNFPTEISEELYLLV